MKPETAWRIALVLVGLDLALVLVYVLDAALGVPSRAVHQLFNLDAEATVPAWYTSAKLLLAGTLFLWLSAQPAAAVASRHFLLVIGVAFVFLSLDETAGLHEQITFVLRRFETLPRFTGNHGLWVPFYVVGGVGLVAITAGSWRRLWHRDRRGATLLGLGAALVAVGGVGLEVVSYEVVRPSGSRALYVLEVALEEGLELLGASVLLLGSLRVVAADSAAPAAAS